METNPRKKIGDKVRKGKIVRELKRAKKSVDLQKRCENYKKGKKNDIFRKENRLEHFTNI